MTKTILMSGVAAAAILAAGTAAAETTVTATTDLNIRSGPGAWYDVVGTIPAEAEATVTSCYKEVNWCEVAFEGTTGWSFGEYLVVGGETPVAIVAPEVVEDQSITITRLEVDDRSGEAAAAGAGWGAIAGSLIGGPVGAAFGTVIAAGAADAAVDPELTAYVESHPVEPVYLDGELVVGAGIPTGIELYELPEDEGFAYVNVNGTPVIVDAKDRRVVTIVN